MPTAEVITYDQAVQQVEQILHELESQEAISITEYQRKAKQATALLRRCQAEIKELENELTKV